MSGPTDQRPVILFDGVCNLCNATVTFIIDRDPTARFAFAPLQSPAGQALLDRFGLPRDLQSIVLVEGGKHFTRSTAALRVARRLGGAWPAMYAFIVLPSPLRNAVYDWIARNRYRWFGHQDACRMPTPALAARFLDDLPQPQSTAGSATGA